MPIAMCGSAACGASTAELKCARCQGVFYCDEACQKTDWKRHRPYCKPLPSPEGSSKLRRGLQCGQVSSSEADTELLNAVIKFAKTVIDQPKLLRKELPRVLILTRSLLARGARPYVLVDGNPRTSCVAALCELGSTGMQPLLELLLAADPRPRGEPVSDFQPADGH